MCFCFATSYDPSLATYSASILKIIRLGGILTVCCLVGAILIFRRRESGRGSGSQTLRNLHERGAH